MDGDKQVRVGFVGYFGTVIESNALVFVAREGDFYAGTLRLDLLCQTGCDIQGEGLFVVFTVTADGSRVCSAMPRVYCDTRQAEGLRSRRKQREEGDKD